MKGICTSIYFILVAGCLPFSCVKSIDLDISSDMEPILVIDGQLTDLNSPYNNYSNYVRLTWTRSNSDRSVIPVDSALVIIISSRGERDTLVNEKKIKGKNDPKLFEGYYYPKNLVCSAGVNYHLSVQVKGRSYFADAKMMSVPKIDSIGLVYVKDVVSSFNGCIPLISFNEPQNERNYYLTQFCTSTYGRQTNIYRLPCQWRSDLWNVAILNDEHLPPYVKELNINAGTTPSPTNVGWLDDGDYVAYLYSLTPEAYRYYQTLIKSLQSDGGVYSPTPATAPTNIESKFPAAGFFNVSSVSFYDFKVKLPPDQ
jgi:hypothetical protein